MALDIVALDNLLKDHKKTQIAREMDITITNFSQKIHGERKFTVDEALRLSKILGLKTIDEMQEIWK